MKHRRIIACIAAGAAALSFQASAASISASAGNNYYSIQAHQTLAPGIYGSLGYLNTDARGGNNDLYDARIMFGLPVPLDVRVGARYQYQNTPWGSGGGLGLGASAHLPTPIPRVDVGGYGFITPSGLTHGDMNDSYEYGVQARATLFAQTNVLVGYRHLRTDIAGTGDYTMHSGVVFGVSVGF